MQTSSFVFGPQVCGDLDIGGAREWLVPDGLGGYAMGTVSGLRTRRYHGLLVVAGQTPASRDVGLVSLDPIVVLPGGEAVRLATHEWHDGTIAPRGHELLSEFRLVNGLPRWRWQIGDLVIERELAMRHGHSCVAVTHRLLGGPAVQLIVEVVGTWRDQHGERHADSGLTVTDVADGPVVADAYRVLGPQWEGDGTWLYGVRCRMEDARGYVPVEDVLRIGTFTSILTNPGDVLDVTAWSGDLAATPPPAREIIESARRRNAAIAVGPEPTLALAADAFIVRTAAGPDVVAGYPWFGAWSRDTMTSYEGLFLSTGRVEEGAQLLRGYAGTLSEGMLANTADTGELGYNTADATLWFLHAVERHVTATGDTALAADLLPALESVLKAHLEGTRYGIRVDPADGLLRQGVAGEALTWMDARVDGVPVTWRAGKAVDINALWCNGLAAIATLRERTGSDASELRGRYDATVAEFRRRFPSPAGHLFDTIEPDDMALRPNQLLAYSLPYAPMAPDPAVAARIGAALLTPLGPRSLTPNDRMYQSSHGGVLIARDRAYHQGTVWPWLLGPMLDTYRKSGLPITGMLDGIRAHLGEYGLGSISETADGGPPHRATGCPYQAWSVAEVIRTCLYTPET
jgi:predicted glycogen debranching enzyme